MAEMGFEFSMMYDKRFHTVFRVSLFVATDRCDKDSLILHLLLSLRFIFCDEDQEK